MDTILAIFAASGVLFIAGCLILFWYAWITQGKG